MCIWALQERVIFPSHGTNAETRWMGITWLGLCSWSVALAALLLLSVAPRNAMGLVHFKATAVPPEPQGLALELRMLLLVTASQ
jgi:hypothetical protein